MSKLPDPLLDPAKYTEVLLSLHRKLKAPKGLRIYGRLVGRKPHSEEENAAGERALVWARTRKRALRGQGLAAKAAAAQVEKELAQRYPRPVARAAASALKARRRKLRR